MRANLISIWRDLHVCHISEIPIHTKQRGNIRGCLHVDVATAPGDAEGIAPLACMQCQQADLRLESWNQPPQRLPGRLQSALLCLSPTADALHRREKTKKYECPGDKAVRSRHHEACCSPLNNRRMGPNLGVREQSSGGAICAVPNECLEGS